MSKPAIPTVDDDPMVSAAITRDLRQRYGAEYRVIGATTGQKALDLLAGPRKDRPDGCVTCGFVAV